MSLDDFKKNLEKIKNVSGDYARFLDEKKSIELDIKNLKAKYRQNKVERDVFSEYNKKLIIKEKELSKIKTKVLGLCRKNDEIINDEMKNVF